MSISVHTAQNVAVDYAPAGLLERILATAIDYCVLVGVGVPLSQLAFYLYDLAGATWGFYIVYIPLVAYHLICEAAFHGQSLGKLAMRLRVARLDGGRLTFWHCFLRWVFRLVDITLLGGSVAIIAIICSRRSQRLGDMAAGTTVIRRPRLAAASLADPYDPPADHEVVFPQAALLSDADLRVIREVLAEVKHRGDYSLLPPLVTRLKAITGITSSLPNLQFAETLLCDAIHLAKQ